MVNYSSSHDIFYTQNNQPQTVHGSTCTTFTFFNVFLIRFSLIMSLHLLSLPGCLALRPRQPAAASREGEERGIPHAPLHSSWLPSSAERNDRSQRWQETDGEEPVQGHLITWLMAACFELYCREKHHHGLKELLNLSTQQVIVQQTTRQASPHVEVVRRRLLSEWCSVFIEFSSLSETKTRECKEGMGGYLT